MNKTNSISNTTDYQHQRADLPSNTSRRPVSLTALLLVGVMIFAATGCHRPEVELSKVSGIVTLDGEPLPNATVRFVPTGPKGRTALGRTDAIGRYEMQYSATANGAVVGQVRVEITTAEETEQPGGRTRMGKEILPPRYHESSELTAEIGRNENIVDFDLKSE